MEKKKSGIMNRAGTSPLTPLPSGEGDRRKGALKSDAHAAAGSGQAVRSAPLRGAGKSGEGRLPRVPIDPIPFNTWKIKRLPPDLKEELDRMFSEGTMHSCRQLAKWLGDNGFEISHAAIHKYGQKFERKLQAVRLATEQARIVCEQSKGDDAEMQDALLRLVQTQLFNVLTVSKQETSGNARIAPVNLGALARCVSNLAKTETELRKRAERARTGVAEAEKKVDEARAKGLSKDAAEQIKAVLMEI
jgi:hypothetical protein